MATVLALHGDELSLSSLQSVLESFGHVVVPVTNHGRALASICLQDFDLLLVDIQQENLNPVGLIGAVLKAKPRARIVAITAYPKAPTTLSVLKLGIHSLMKKPYEIGRILAILGERRP